MSHDPAAVRSLLLRLGYSIRIRDDGFATCLLARGPERWLGHGLDADGSLLDALAQALPSHAAREGLGLLLLARDASGQDAAHAALPGSSSPDAAGSLSRAGLEDASIPGRSLAPVEVSPPVGPSPPIQPRAPGASGGPASGAASSACLDTAPAPAGATPGAAVAATAAGASAAEVVPPAPVTATGAASTGETAAAAEARPTGARPAESRPVSARSAPRDRPAPAGETAAAAEARPTGARPAEALPGESPGADGLPSSAARALAPLVLAPPADSLPADSQPPSALPSGAPPALAPPSGAPPALAPPAGAPPTPAQGAASPPAGLLDGDLLATAPPAIPPEPTQAVPVPTTAAATAGPVACLAPAAEVAAPLPESEPRTPPLSPEEALEQIASMGARIEASLPDLAWSAPRTQRLAMTALMAEARAVQDAVPGDARIERAIGGIASVIAGRSRQWWPGSVTVLMRQATPRDSARKIGLADAEIDSWARLAAAAYGELEAQQDDGWADDRALEPRPPAPDAVFAGLRREMEALLGSLEDDHPERLADLAADDGTGKALRRWATWLRWLRLAVVDAETWARAVGRLRWLARRSRAAAGYLDPALDPDARPPAGTWAKELGEDPEAQRLRTERIRVLRALPGAAASRQDVAGWLSGALALGPVLPIGELATLLLPLEDLVAQVAPDDLATSQRSLRSRLRRLQALMKDEPSPLPIEPLAADPAEPQDEIDPLERMLALVLPKVRGSRALFVGNRADPQLHDALERRLGLAVTWCEGDPRRVQAACQQVAQLTYDVVLLATGFQGHAADDMLGRAARSAGVLFVRAGKGRTAAVVRALARDLGLLHAGAGLAG